MLGEVNVWEDGGVAIGIQKYLLFHHFSFQETELTHIYTKSIQVCMYTCMIYFNILIICFIYDLDTVVTFFNNLFLLFLVFLHISEERLPNQLILNKIVIIIPLLS